MCMCVDVGVEILLSSQIFNLDWHKDRKSYHCLWASLFLLSIDLTSETNLKASRTGSKSSRAVSDGSLNHDLIGMALSAKKMNKGCENSCLVQNILCLPMHILEAYRHRDVNGGLHALDTLVSNNEDLLSKILINWSPYDHLLGSKSPYPLKFLAFWGIL